MEKMGRPYLGDERNRLRRIAQIAGMPRDAAVLLALAGSIDRMNFAIGRQ
jgi:hypothetical protein